MPSTAKLSFALLGYVSAVLAARAFAFLQATCSVGCFKKPSVMGLVPHHLYYGVGIVVLSMFPLLFAHSPVVKWDASLFLGAGTGLIADELGPFVKVSQYWSQAAIMFPILIGSGFAIVTVGLILRGHNIREFHMMQRWDVGTTMSLVLFMFGFLYFEKALGLIVQFVGLGSWMSSAALMLMFGKQHFTRPIILPEVKISEHV